MSNKNINRFNRVLFLLMFVSIFLFASQDTNRQIADVLSKLNNNNLSKVVRKIKEINPEKGVIESIRALNKGELGNSKDVQIDIIKYQQNVRKKLIEIRKRYLAEYCRENPIKARSLYGIGDIGSWVSGGIGAAADFDWSLFGVDSQITDEVSKGYERKLASELGLSESSDLLKEFDIVVTPEGHEERSGVYGNKASKDWASRNFKNFTLISPDGKITIYQGGDVIAERANAQRMAEIRKLMSEKRFGNAYEILFDSRGNFQLENQSKLSPDAKKALHKLLGELDMFKAKGETSSGGTIEMAAHLHHEVLSDAENMKAKDLLDKINKYASRGETMKHLGGLPENAIDNDMVLGKNGDSNLREAYEFIMKHKGLRKEKLVEIYGKKLDKSKIEQLGKNVEKVLERLAVIQFQHQIDKTMMIENTKTRNSKLQEIKSAFEADLPKKLYPKFHQEIFKTIEKAKALSYNEPKLKQVQDAIKSQKKLIEIESKKTSDIKRLNEFLNKTFAGQKIRTLLQKVNKVKIEYGLKPNDIPIMELAKSVSQNPVLETSQGEPMGAGAKVVHYLGTAALLVGAIEAIEKAQTDADLAIALGHVWASSTLYGLIASETYTGISEGHPERVAKAIMFMLVPEAAIPDLVKALGLFASASTQKLFFDDQMNAFYVLSNYYDKNKTKEVCSSELVIDRYIPSGLVKDLYLSGSHSLIGKMHEDALEKVKKEKEISFAKAYVVEKSLKNLKYYGNVAIFPGYAPLVQAAMTIKKINEQIDIMAKIENAEIPKEQDHSWLDSADGISRGLKQAIRKLMIVREEEWKNIETFLAKAIESSFREKCFAEVELDQGKENAQKLLKEVLNNFERLSVKEPCQKALETTGKFNSAAYLFASDRDVQMKAMKAVLKYKNAYSYIFAIREIIKAKIKASTRTYPVPVPLDGWPALVCKPSVDIANTNIFRHSIMTSIDEIDKKLDSIEFVKTKKEKMSLDSKCRQDIIRELIINKYRQEHYTLLLRNYKWVQDNKLYWFEVLDNNTIDDRLSKLHDKKHKLFGEFIENLNRYKNSCFVLKKDIQDKASDKNIKENNETKDTDIKTVPPEDGAKKVQGDEAKGKEVKEQGGSIKSTPPSEDNTPGKNNIKDESNIDSPKSKQPKVQDATNKNPKTVQKPDKKIDSSENSKIEKEWISKIEEAFKGRDCAKMRQIHSKLMLYGKNKMAIGYKYPEAGKLLSKYQAQMAREKEKWFSKDLLGYLRKVKNLIRSQDPYDKSVAEGRRMTDDEEACRKIVKSERKRYSQIIQEHKKTVKKLFELQGHSVEICDVVDKFVKRYEIPKSLEIAEKYKNICKTEPKDYKFSVEISGKKNISLSSRESVTLKATVVGGKKPVILSWEGGNISPSGSTAIFAATTAGSYTVQVVAKDADGETKTDVVSIKVKKIDLPSLGGLPNEVYYGTSKVISVEGVESNTPDSTSSNGVDCTKNPDSPFCVSTNTDAVKKPCKNPFDEDCRVRVSQVSGGGSVGVIMAAADDTEDIAPPASVKEEKEGVYEYVWISSKKGIEFDPPSSKELQVKVTFGNIGSVEIWAEVHKDGELLGETEPVKTKVIPPKFTLNVEPKTLYMGDEAKAIISLEPNIDDKFTEFTWLPMGNNAQKLIESQNGRSTTLKLTNIKPTTIEVLVKAKSPYYGDEIGRVKYVISAKPYKVDISKPKRLDKAPWKWDPKQGKAIELPQAIAVFQNAEVHATITPEPKEKVSYRWTVTPEGCTVSAPMSKSTNLNAHEAKTYTVSVKVSDKNGVELGKSSTSFAVTVSQRDLDVAKQKAKDQKKAKVLLQEARKFWKNGKLKQAIAKAVQAQKLAGKEKETAKTLKAMQRQKKDLDAKLDRATVLIKNEKLKDAESILSQAARISEKYDGYKKVLKQLSDAKKKAEDDKKKLGKLLKEAKVFKDAGKLNKAVKILIRGQKLFPDNKEITKLLKSVQKQQKEALKKMKEGQKQWKAGELDGAISILEEAAKMDRSNKKIAKVLKDKQLEKNVVDGLLKKADRLIGQKKFKEGKRVLVKAGYISKKYPPYVEMVKKLDSSQKKEISNRIRKIREEAEKRAKIKKQKALAAKIKAIREAAKERARIKKEKERKATLAEKIRKIREEAEEEIETKGNNGKSVTIPKAQSTKNIVVTFDENIFPGTARDSLADSYNYVIDGDESHAWARVLFVDPALGDTKGKSLTLILTISKVADASSRNGLIIYHNEVVVGKVGAVTRGQVVEAPLDISKMEISSGRLELILRAAGTDAPYIMSKASGQGAQLKIVSNLNKKTDGAKKAKLADKIRKIREEAKKRAKIKKQKALAAKIKAIREAAEERARIQKDRDEGVVPAINSSSRHIKLGSFSGALTQQSPHANHKIVMPEDGELHIKVTNGPKLGFYCGIRLRDRDNKTQIGRDCRGLSFSVAMLRAGAYYLDLTKDGRKFYYGPYSVDVSMDTQKFANDKESNDAFEKAESIGLNQTIQGHLGGNWQGKKVDILDYWRVTIPKSGKMEIAVSTSEKLNLYGGITVYNSDKKGISRTYIQGPNSSKKHLINKIEPGIYYIKIEKDDRGFYWGSYQLRVSLILRDGSRVKSTSDKLDRENIDNSVDIAQREKEKKTKKSELATKIKAIREAAKERARIKKEKERKATLAKKIRKIREEAKKRAKIKNQKALAAKIKAIREAAEERAGIKKEKEQKAALSENISQNKEEDIIVGTWKSSKGAIVRFKKNHLGVYVGIMEKVNSKLMRYGFKKGEVAYKMVYKGKGKYRGKVIQHFSNGNVSWINITKVVRGNLMDNGAWKRISFHAPKLSVGARQNNVIKEDIDGIESIDNASKEEAKERVYWSGTYKAIITNNSGEQATIILRLTKNGNMLHGKMSFQGTTVLLSGVHAGNKGTVRVDGRTSAVRLEKNGVLIMDSPMGKLLFEKIK